MAAPDQTSSPPQFLSTSPSQMSTTSFRESTSWSPYVATHHFSPRLPLPQVLVSESAPLGHSVALVTATDPDSDSQLRFVTFQIGSYTILFLFSWHHDFTIPSSRFRLDLSSSEAVTEAGAQAPEAVWHHLFSMDAATGRLTTSALLDREQVREWEHLSPEPSTGTRGTAGGPGGGYGGRGGDTGGSLQVRGWHVEPV